MHDSPHMAAKQKEMDAIVRDIYSAMESQRHLQSSLFVLLGDHGMNEAGNHGGSFPGEVSAALVFISPKFKAVCEGSETPTSNADGFQYYVAVEQSDIVPTLAALLAFPIPRNNLGIIIPGLLKLWTQGRDVS